MATGGRETDITILQDETFDLLCSPCARKNRNTEAQKYCVDCKDYYCSKCVDCHEEIPALSGHTIFDKGQFQPAPKQALPPVPTERCDILNHKHVDMYCEDHDVVGCSTCMAIDHRWCKGTFFIPDYIQNNPSACVQEDVKQELETTAKQLRECQDKFEVEKEPICRNEDMAIQEIGKFRDKAVKRIRDLAELTVKETNDQCKPILVKADEELKTLHRNEMEALSARESIVSAGSNVSQVFVSNKKGKLAVFRGNKCADECKVAIPTADIKFETNEIISDLLAGMNSLGNFKVEGTKKADSGVTKEILGMTKSNDTPHTSDRGQSHPRKTPTNATHLTDKASQSANRGLQPTTDCTEQTVENQNTSIVQQKTRCNMVRKDPSVLLKIEEMKKYNVKISSDKNDCGINGACVLENGTVILTNYRNQKLKQVDGTTYTVTDYCDLPAHPWQVCVIRNKEVAVSCRTAGVQFVSLQTKIVLTRKMKPDHNCDGADGHLFISDDTSVYIYTLSGTKLQQFSKGPSRRGCFIPSRLQSLFSCINRIAVNDDGSNIYVADAHNGLFVLDRNGAVTGKYSGPQLKEPAYICVTENGSILVTDTVTKSIFQFGANCNFVGEVLKSKTDRKFYRTLAYNPSKSRIIGGAPNTNEIGVYELV